MGDEESHLTKILSNGFGIFTRLDTLTIPDQNVTSLINEHHIEVKVSFTCDPSIGLNHIILYKKDNLILVKAVNDIKINDKPISRNTEHVLNHLDKIEFLREAEIIVPTFPPVFHVIFPTKAS